MLQIVCGDTWNLFANFSTHPNDVGVANINLMSASINFDLQWFSPRSFGTFVNPVLNACLQFSEGVAHSRFDNLLSMRFPFKWFTSRFSLGLSKKAIAARRWILKCFLPFGVNRFTVIDPSAIKFGLRILPI